MVPGDDERAQYIYSKPLIFEKSVNVWDSMADFATESAAIWMIAIMAISVFGPTVTGIVNEGGTDQRVPAGVPLWKDGDYWVYEFKQRFTNYTISVNFGSNGTGSAHMSGTLDSTDSYNVFVVSDPTYYRVAHRTETWENGTYTLTDPGGNTSTPAPYKYHTVVTTPLAINMRKSDLAIGNYTQKSNITRTYDNTSLGSIGDTTLDRDDAFSYPLGPLALYRFPMDLHQSWVVTGRQVDEFQQTLTYIDAGISVVYIGGTTTDYTIPATTSLTYDPQITPAGLFNDAIRIWYHGSTSWTEQGISVQNGGPPQTITDNGDTMINEYRWYSSTAGFIVNWNSTSPTNGDLLCAYHYSPIPPNFVPQVKTIDGQAYNPTQTITVDCREDSEKRIEIVIQDNDTYDTINWSLANITGAPGNPKGAELMDNDLVFEQAVTTGNSTSHIHTNKLVITARQPRTVDSDTYIITANVNDGNDLGSVNFTFNITVININDKPYVAMTVPDIWMRENSTMACTTWKMTDIFMDPDREAGISQDRLTFTASVTAGPPVEISIDNDTGLAVFHVRDYAWDHAPFAGWDATIKFTASDSGCGNASDICSNITNTRLHIEHVNHDVTLSANGTALEENGLTWNEDILDTRLDLNRVFSDPDVGYADDVLTFAFSGQKSIAVKNTASRISLAPAKDWYGKETIIFRATDKAGRSEEFRLDCTVLPVPDAPSFCETGMKVLWSDTEELTLKEAPSPNGPLNTLRLNVSVEDPDETMGAKDPHSCQWWVNDSKGNIVYMSSAFLQGNDEYEFRCQWTGAFSASLSPYEVKCVARDSSGLTSSYKWNVTVLNVNRPPLALIDSPMDNRTFSKGQKIYFDAWNSSDPDEARDNLTFIWNSSRQGMIKQARGIAGAEFSDKDLNPGKHIITLTIRDSDGGETSMSFTVKVNEAPSGIPGFEVMALVASIAVAVVVLGRRRKWALLFSRPPQDEGH
jgi:hypothetical protein